MNHDADLGDVLLRLARGAIGARLGRSAQHDGPPTNVPVVPSHPALREPGATFVTLHRDGALRGCIGSVAARRSLGEDVRANAEAAAFRDPRFPPLAGDEFDVVDIEVSLLGSSERIACADEAAVLAQLRPHVDGVILDCGAYRSTFLPQVWTQLPDPRDFLAALKRKAGLPAGYWSPQIELSRYTVAKFAEGARDVAENGR